MKKYNVAVVGATGEVGKTMREILEERKFPVNNIKLLASARSEGKVVEFCGKAVKVEKLTKDSFIYTVSNLCVNEDDPLGVFYSVEALQECHVLLIDVKKFKSLFLTKPENMDHLVAYYVMSRPIGFWGPVRAEAIKQGLIKPSKT